MVWYGMVSHGMVWHGVVMYGTVGHSREVSYSKGAESRTVTSLHVGSTGEEVRAETPSHPSLPSTLKPQKPWRPSHTSAPGLTVPTCAGPGPAPHGRLFTDFYRKEARFLKQKMIHSFCQEEQTSKICSLVCEPCECVTSGEQMPPCLSFLRLHTTQIRVKKHIRR